MILVDSFEDLCSLLQKIKDARTTYVHNCKSKLKQQTTISSYHTTKRAQYQVINSIKQEDDLLQVRYDAVQQVIHSLRSQLKVLYPRQKFRTERRHYRSKEMKKSFVDAQEHLVEISQQLTRVREQEQQAQTSLAKAKAAYQSLKDDESTSEQKLTQARDRRQEKRDDLKRIQNEITRVENDQAKEQEVYREKAMKIYEQCRILEQERLDLIRQTLIDFIRAYYSTEYTLKQNTIYEELLVNIESQQNTSKDLDFWAKTYKVFVSTDAAATINDDDDEIIEPITATS